MKYILLILAFAYVNAGIARNKKDTSSVKKDTSKPGPSAIGMVSHKYKECGTVILVYDKKIKDTNVMIPFGSPGLGEFDVDGLMISFRYRNLKVKNPKGCMIGGPVHVWDIAKVKIPVHHKRSKKKATHAK